MPPRNTPGAAGSNGRTTNTNKGANKETNKKKGASKGRLLKEDYETILDWLEDPLNYDSIYGPKRTSIGNPHGSAMKGYNKLAGVVNSRNKGRLNLNGKAVKERFGRHKRLYEEVKEKSEKTGFGLTDEDHENGINTIRAKLESM
ncbi:hypothetical protein BGX26_004303, partial [Mortierella sp. AD094]